MRTMDDIKWPSSMQSRHRGRGGDLVEGETNQICEAKIIIHTMLGYFKVIKLSGFGVYDVGLCGGN